MNNNDRVSVIVDTEKKQKARYVLGLQGKDLSVVIRQMVDELAEEFDKMMKEQNSK